MMEAVHRTDAQYVNQGMWSPTMEITGITWRFHGIHSMTKSTLVKSTLQWIGQTTPAPVSLRLNWMRMLLVIGLPGGTRTPYPELRRFVLYPDELPAGRGRFCQIAQTESPKASLTPALF